jgi:hypothetical protein
MPLPRIHVTRGREADFEFPERPFRSIALTPRLEEVVTGFRTADVVAVRRLSVKRREPYTPFRIAGPAVELRW